jgi:Holliday junction resolvase RusA-like endonuclease
LHAPFSLPAEALEIVIDLPFPTSTNRLWGNGRGRTFKSKEYQAWIHAADTAVLLDRSYPRQRKMYCPFTIHIALSNAHRGQSDGDNRIKAALDWLQSRDIIRNDKDCERGSWAWVHPDDARRGCRLTLRSWHA